MNNSDVKLEDLHFYLIGTEENMEEFKRQRLELNQLEDRGD